MKVYALGGLGVDDRIFSNLKLDVDLIVLKWMEPKPKESIHNYAVRLSEQIDDSDSIMIIGVSFGGMIALELNKILKPKKVILISSASSRSDIPLIFRLLGRTGILNIVPDSLIRPPNFLANYLFGISDPYHKKTLQQILADTDILFLRWALNKIIHWDNQEMASNIIRIHGSADRLLKYSKAQNIMVLPKAGHFMIMERADEISIELKTIINYQI